MATSNVLKVFKVAPESSNFACTKIPNFNAFQIKFEDESVLGVRREDVYIEGVELPTKVRHKMVNISFCSTHMMALN